MVREILQFHTELLVEPDIQVREARALLALLTRTEDREDATNAALRAELRECAERSDQALAHDDLSPDHQAVYFHQFVAHAAAHGLQFLAEAEPQVSAHAGLSAATRGTLASMDRVCREQYLDFLRCRRFRQTLVCRNDRSIEPMLLADALDELHVVAAGAWSQRLMRGDETHAQEANEALAPAARRVVATVRDAWPATLTFAEVVERVGTGAAEVRDLVREGAEAGMLDLLARSRPASAVAGEHPCASAYARFQAIDGETVVNLHYQPLRIEDARVRTLLALLDGTRDRAELRAALDVDDEPSDDAWLDRHLERLARFALLLA